MVKEDSVKKTEIGNQEVVGNISSRIIFDSKIMKVVGELIGYGLFLLFLFEFFPRFGFVTDVYKFWKPIAFWTATIVFIFQVLKHFTKNNFLKKLFEIGILTASIYSTQKFFYIYPFVFSKIGYDLVDEYLPYLLMIVICAMILALVIKIIRIFPPQRKTPTSK